MSQNNLKISDKIIETSAGATAMLEAVYILLKDTINIPEEDLRIYIAAIMCVMEEK